MEPASGTALCSVCEPLYLCSVCVCEPLYLASVCVSFLSLSASVSVSVCQCFRLSPVSLSLSISPVSVCVSVDLCACICQSVSASLLFSLFDCACTYCRYNKGGFQHNIELEDDAPVLLSSLTWMQHSHKPHVKPLAHSHKSHVKPLVHSHKPHTTLTSSLSPCDWLHAHPATSAMPHRATGCCTVRLAAALWGWLLY